MAEGDAIDQYSGAKLAHVSDDDRSMCVPSAAPAPVAAEGLSLDAFLAGISARAFRFAELGLRHRDDALDAVQDAMIRMMGYRERPAAEWTPLFWSILRSRIVDMQRRSLFRMRWLVAPTMKSGDDDIDWTEHAPDDAPDPSRTHDHKEAYRTLASALRALPARQREAFTLRVLEDCDVATTARIMGCSKGSVKTHLSLARDTLQKQLEDFR
jgi:RNA polymerase sigma-70 factor, ECF subfamily